jgi:hypothetical protein
MKFGAEPKKVAILGGLTLVAAYFLYTDLMSSPTRSSEPAARRTSVRPSVSEVTPSAAPEPAPVQTAVARTLAMRRSEQEFRPSFKNKGIDPSTIDPKLRLDLLAKVRSVDVGPAARNLFAYGAMTPASLPAGTKDPGKIIPKPGSPLAPGSPVVGPGGSQPAPPPPITLKYYGYTAQRSDGRKRAFFSEGDCTANASPTAPECDIFVAAEGDLILKRYKVIRIGPSSAEVEDTQFNHTQPLPIAQESPG